MYYEGCINMVEDIKRENEELDKMDMEINDNFTNELEKVKFIDRIQNKINKLSNFRIYLQFKYDDIKYAYDFFSIFIIIISAFLTIMEAVKNEIDYENENDSIKYFFKLGPIFISSLITLLGTFLKFKKYQEESEEMSSVLEKSVLTIYRMKKLQEKLYYADNLKLASLKDMYIDEIFILYNQSQVEIRNCISFTDLQKYEIKRLKYEKLNSKKAKKKLGIKKKKEDIPERFSSGIDSIDEDNFRDNINASPGPGAEMYKYNNYTIKNNKNINNNKNENVKVEIDNISVASTVQLRPKSYDIGARMTEGPKNYNNYNNSIRDDEYLKPSSPKDDYIEEEKRSIDSIIRNNPDAMTPRRNNKTNIVNSYDF